MEGGQADCAFDPPMRRTPTNAPACSQLRWTDTELPPPPPQCLLSCSFTYHSHEVSPSWRAAGVLDFCSVSSRVGKEAVLLNGDLKKCTVSHRFSLGLWPSWATPNLPGLQNKPTPPIISEQGHRQKGLWTQMLQGWQEAGEEGEQRLQREDGTRGPSKTQRK